MVTKLAEIEPRSSGEVVLTNSETGEDFFRPELTRTTYIIQNDLDTYAEVDLRATHSADPEFNHAVSFEEGIPVLPGKVRESSYLDSNELVQIIADIQGTPTSGSLVIYSESDHTPKDSQASELNTFEELNDGRTYVTDIQTELGADDTLTAGIRVPESSPSSIFVRQFGLGVGADALITTEIDHGSYTAGSPVPIINKKPELQDERPIEAEITQDPTISDPQISMTAFLPGGSGGSTALGDRYRGADYEITPGQDLTIEIQNDSSGADRFGFSLELIETVIR